MSTPRVLLVAHHANPAWTSEPLIGWRWALGLSSRAETTLVTHIRNRDAIEAARGGGCFQGQVRYIDTERVAGRVQRWNDRLFPNAGSVNRLLLETLGQRAFDREAVRVARGLVRTGRIDIIHRVSPISPRYPSHLGRLGVPFVLGPVNGGLTMPPGFPSIAKEEGHRLLGLRGAARLLDPFGRTARSASAVWIANETTRSVLPLSERNRAEVVCENAVQLGSFDSSSPRPSGRLRLLFLGRLLPYKGVQFVLRALAAADLQGRVEFEIVGDGDYRAALEAEASALGLTQAVRFVGQVAHSRVSAHLRRCDALVLPSVRESGGSVVLEAMAASRPVLVANHGGPAETVAPGTGFRLPCPDEGTLIRHLHAAIGSLAASPDACRHMGHLARSHVESHYTWSAQFDRAMETYSRLMGCSAPRPTVSAPHRTRIAS